jgi:very-short-patch-repair endonuclease
MTESTRGKCPWTSEQAAYMRTRQNQNKVACQRSSAETWMANKLAGTGYKWTRQAVWGWRIFDFWCHTIGVAVEVDGPEHDAAKERERDDYNFQRSGIVVLRVPNWNEQEAATVLAGISTAETWNERRAALGLSLITYGNCLSLTDLDLPFAVRLL